MSVCTQLKGTFRDLKTNGMKPPQIGVLGEFVCTIIEMGPEEFKDVFPDLMKLTFEIVEPEEQKIETFAAPVAPTLPTSLPNPPGAPTPPQKKLCPGCNKMLEADRFNKHANEKDGLQRLCKTCFAKTIADQTERRIANVKMKVFEFMPTKFSRHDTWDVRRIALKVAEKDRIVKAAVKEMVNEGIMVAEYVKDMHTTIYCLAKGSGAKV